MRLCIRFLELLVIANRFAQDVDARGTVGTIASPDLSEARFFDGQKDLGGKADLTGNVQDLRNKEHKDIASTNKFPHIADNSRTGSPAHPASSRPTSREGLRSKEKYFDLNEGIEPESHFHENNLRRPAFIFSNWLKGLWLRLGDRFCDKIFKRKLRSIYKTPSKKSIYDPVPLNTWDVLDDHEMKKEAADLRIKLLEDFRSHPVFLKENEEIVTSPELLSLLKWFEDFKEPKDWSDSTYSRLVASLVAKVQTEEALDSKDIMTLQLIKYIGFFNPPAREVFKTIAHGRGKTLEEVPVSRVVSRVWRKLITADLLFQDHPRQTYYPHRYHGLLEQTSMEWREEFRRRFIAGKLTYASANPPLSFRRREERQLRKIFGELNEIQFISHWPYRVEGFYVNPEGLVRKCANFLAQQVHLPPNSNPQHPVKLVYKILNHIYEHSKADADTQILIEKLIKRNVYLQKTVYAHVLLRQKFTPQEFASLNLLEDMGFYKLLTPGMRKHLQEVSDRKILSKIAGDIDGEVEDTPHSAQEKQELQPLVTPNSNADPATDQRLHDELELTIKRLDGIRHDLDKIGKGKLPAGQHGALIREQDKLLSRLIGVVLQGPRIWRSMREKLIKQPDLKERIFGLLSKKAVWIWEHRNDRGKQEGSYGLADFLHPMDKEISEFVSRTEHIDRLQSLVDDKFNKNTIDREAANDITDFLFKIEQIWLEIKWSSSRWGVYDMCPVELSKEALKLIREYAFGRLPADVHELLVNLIAHLTYADSTGHLKDMDSMAFNDAVDYRAFAFFQRVVPEAANNRVQFEREILDGLSGEMQRALKKLESEPTVYTL
ncbi:hypothetical protein PSTG_11095 [Puccinia striiformis f. sp. tritici PST-78]|uniref:Uncharacterized protein n=1 Tax=Puccinia striiformis f. sp. tritici PST-78 TaxID=1165861 RepID=A0A0L0V9D0_9BASI|nr:hypothetical protein PSTG_11079 [Puccinia striiformis f. sp. tritici PST-78]KNE95606.1 hypothetical protein PSTG_11095 [Puccinia striiformis f. sp. tritici PST-78]